MAVLAHDASGPASSEPAGIAQQQANRPGSSDKGKLRVFISYSRDDLDFADQLTAALDFSGFECFIDREGISGGEEWKRSLGGLISEADTVVFVLTPNSARSPICDWEVEEATRLSKRILPIVCRPLEGVSPPPRLRELNYIFFYKEPKVPGSGFGTGLAKLVTALNTDFDWLREHTRYLQRAIEWDTGGQPANRLLSGNDIPEANTWAARRPRGAPEPTALQFDFIRASEKEAEARLSEQRKQLEAMSAAQTEREMALRKAEEAQRKRATMARIRNIAFVVASILALLATSAMMTGWWLYWQADRLRHVAEEQRAFAEKQKAFAEEQREQGDHILDASTTIIFKFEDQMDVNTKKQVFAVFQTGADHGSAYSMVNLGNLYKDGQGVAQDYSKAREWYEKAADKGLWAGMANLAVLYRDGFGVAQDYTKARELYEKVADQDESGEIMVNLGVFYHNGDGVAQDYAKARQWYEKAADKNNGRAMFNLGVLYRDGSGVAQDYTKAREWFQKAADKNNAEAMAILGGFYVIGLGVARDYAKAREWHEKAAEKGNAFAMFVLGAFYDEGLGVAKDYAKAREWYEKAAEKGDANGMTNLGALYKNGKGVTRDYAKAREWYEKAAEKGDASAMAELGHLYEEEQDYAKAREWYEKAANKGESRANAQLEQLATREAAAAGRYVRTNPARRRHTR
jgi:TPR repeat protein